MPTSDPQSVHAGTMRTNNNEVHTTSATRARCVRSVAKLSSLISRSTLASMACSDAALHGYGISRCLLGDGRLLFEEGDREELFQGRVEDVGDTQGERQPAIGK